MKPEYDISKIRVMLMEDVDNMEITLEEARQIEKQYLLRQAMLNHEAPIAPSCELDPDCANCPFPERKAKWDTIWDKFRDWNDDDELQYQTESKGAM